MRIALMIFMLISVSWCQGTDYKAMIAENANASEISQKSSIALNEPGIDVPVDSTYIVGPGDAFEVLFENKSFVVQVGPEGLFLLEDLGGVNISGLSVVEAKRKILEMAKRKFSPEHVFVQLIRVRKYFVGVYGAVDAPRQLYVSANMRLSYVIREAGWFLPTSDKAHVMLIRGGDTTTIDFDEIESKARIDKDIVTQQGDVVFVPYINLEKGVVTLKYNMTSKNLKWQDGKDIPQYLRDLGIGKTDLSFDGFFYYASPNVQPQYISIQASGNFVPGPNSSIEVVKNLQRVVVGGAVAAPGPQEYHSGWHAIDYVSAAGILPITAEFGSIIAIRNDGTRVNINPYNDPVYPGDYLEIPKSAYEKVKDFTLFAGTVTSIFLTIILAQVYLRDN